MCDAVDGYGAHTCQLDGGCVRLDWTSIDLSVTRDVPKAAVYMHLSKGARKDVDMLMAFRNIAKAVDAARTWIRNRYFQKFLKLPAELRLEVVHEYILLESEAGRLNQHCHYDDFNNPCCMWNFPKVLIACDSQKSKTFPAPETGRAPMGWLPALAFTNKMMQGEVVVHMLQKTERIDLKYDWRNTHFKIATWMNMYLMSYRDNEAVNAVTYLNFPHMHWFNNLRGTPALNNPSVDLIVTCPNLRKLDMTFHASKVTKPDPSSTTSRRIPIPAVDLVNQFRFWNMVKCTQLQELYLDGIYDPPIKGGSPQQLDALESLAKWFLIQFRVQQERVVRIEVVRRWGKWKGRQAGDAVTLNEDDLKEVKDLLAIKNGKMVLWRAVFDPSCWK